MLVSSRTIVTVALIALLLEAAPSSAEDWCASGRATSVGCSEGPCDQPATRNHWFPAIESAETKIRIKFIVFRDDNQEFEATSSSAISAQVTELNNVFDAYRIEFQNQGITFVDCTRFNRLCSGQQGSCHHIGQLYPCIRDDLLCRGGVAETEEQTMKSLYAESPSTQLNVFVVRGDALSFKGVGYGPWCDDATGSPGGVVIAGSQIGGQGACGGIACRVLVHEIGHVLGLWHTHRGVSEVPCADNCRESWQSEGECPTDVEYYDTRGDFCCDTPGTIVKPSDGGCADPYTQDVCPPAHSFSGTGGWPRLSLSTWGHE